MSAQVIAYSANEWDTSLTIKVECQSCQIEWGWSNYSSWMHDRLQDMAASHNNDTHRPTDV